MKPTDIGFVTFAQNTQKVDYLKLAYLQALNCKKLHPRFGYAVIVDYPTSKVIEKKHEEVFDYIIYKPLDLVHPMGNEWQVYYHTPFYETIKLESDLLFTRNIEHWIDAFRQLNIVLSHGCKNYQGNLATNRFYRKFIDENHLPDVYNGLMYFRKHQETEIFFKTAQRIYQNWSTIKDKLNYCFEELPSTDSLYALSALLYGVEKCTLPHLDFINFVHMKPKIQGWNEEAPWHEVVMYEQDNDIIRIHNLNQYYPVHYYSKNFPVDNLIKQYE